MLRQSEETGFLPSWLLNGELVELGIGSDLLHDNSTTDQILRLELTTDLSRSSTSYPSICWAARYEPLSDVLTPASEDHPIDLTSLNLFQPRFQYLRADRVNPSVTYPKSQHAVGNRRFLGSHGEFTAHYLFEYQNEPVANGTLLSSLQGYTDRLLSQTNAWMQIFSPGVILDVANIQSTDLVQLKYTYKTKGIGGGGGKFRATNVGFGLSYSLPIVVACLSALPNSLILIENPEAHLHPEGQLAMGELIARVAASGVQLIVETHSDHVLNGIRLAVKNGSLRETDAVFHFFRRNDSGSPDIISPKISKDGMLSEWPEGFFTEWDKALMGLLT
jgi:predicted ATPase